MRTCKPIGLRFESFGQAKFVEFWRKWTEYDKEDGGTLAASGKQIKLYAQLARFKVMNHEIRDYDKLVTEKRT